MRKVGELDERLRRLQLLFALADCCMDQLSANAWKVVSYIAAQGMRLYPEELENPLLAALHRDLEVSGGIVRTPPSSGDRPYRVVTTELGETRRFAILSLDRICHGVRIRARRFQDYGTGLSKSSAAEAIKEAIQAGILVRERQKSVGGRDQPSLYGIDWDRVMELDWLRKHGKRRVRKLAPKLGVHPPDTYFHPTIASHPGLSGGRTGGSSTRTSGTHSGLTGGG